MSEPEVSVSLWAQSLQQGHLMFGLSGALSCSQLSLDVSLAACHNNIMKQTMVDSSCRILTSDIFQGCNRLVRLCGWREENGPKLAHALRVSVRCEH